MADQPWVAVLPTKYFHGLETQSELKALQSGDVPVVSTRKGEDQPITIHPVVLSPMWDALRKPWDTDAHLTLYLPRDFDPESPFFRCNKDFLPHVRAAGDDILAYWLCVDWDTLGHEPWTRETFEQFASILGLLAKSQTPFGSRLREAVAIYTTTSGARFIFRPRTPVPVDQVEPKIRGLLREFDLAGLSADEASSVSNWAQPFRLPKVLREGENRRRSEDAPFFMLEINEQGTTDTDSIKSIGESEKPRGALDVRESNDPRPQDDEAENLLFVSSPTTGQKIQTSFYKAARERLTGRECFPAIFENALFAEKGARVDTIQRHVGQATSLLLPLREQENVPVTAAHIYALFLPPVRQLEPDKDTHSWPAVLWKAAKHYVALDEAKIKSVVSAASENFKKTLEGVETTDAFWRWLGFYLSKHKAWGLVEQIQDANVPLLTEGKTAFDNGATTVAKSGLSENEVKKIKRTISSFLVSSTTAHDEFVQILHITRRHSSEGNGAIFHVELCFQGKIVNIRRIDGADLAALPKVRSKALEEGLGLPSFGKGENAVWLSVLSEAMKTAETEEQTEEENIHEVVEGEIRDYLASARVVDDVSLMVGDEVYIHAGRAFCRPKHLMRKVRAEFGVEKVSRQDVGEAARSLGMIQDERPRSRLEKSQPRLWSFPAHLIGEALTVSVNGNGMAHHG